MNTIENILREDLWKSIQAHYERADYTESVRDAVFHVCEVLREKSGLYDKDGTKLVESSLMGANPVILVNKNETTTEKDVQQGIGFAFKGIMQSIRNPLSHEKFTYSQDESEAIIRYINFLLNQVDRSGGTTKIDNIMDLLLDEDFTDTYEYAELLLKEVPAKKRYDLLLKLYSNRDKLPQNRLKHFIDALFNSLSKVSKSDFFKAVSISLMKCKDDKMLRMYCHYFMDKTYNEIDKLAQLRMEALFLKSVSAGEINCDFDYDTRTVHRYCSSEGTLSTWITDKIELLSNKEKIIDTLFIKLNRNEPEQDYVFKYFFSVIDKKPSDFSDTELYLIKKQLKGGNKSFVDWLFEHIELWKDEEYINIFGVEYAEGKKLLEQKNQNSQEDNLPF